MSVDGELTGSGSAADGSGVTRARPSLPLLRPSELNGPQADLYREIVEGSRSQTVAAGTLAGNDGSLRGPFNALLVNPELGDAIQKVGVAIRCQTGLSGRIRELAILETAAAARCDYEWASHAVAARREGFSDDEIAAIAEGRPIDDLHPTEAVARSFVSSLLRDGDVEDDTLHQIVSTLGMPATVELIFLIGYYELLARSLRVWRVALPDGASAMRPHFPSPSPGG